MSPNAQYAKSGRSGMFDASRKLQPRLFRSLAKKIVKPFSEVRALLEPLVRRACPCISTSRPKPTYGSPVPFSLGDALVYVAPAPIEKLRGRSVFLAGSIEQGKAVPWQADMIHQLSHIECTIFNPRRDDWDSNWEQRKSNPLFKEQVDWELDCQERADVIAMNFDPKTTSPITLLELGLFADARAAEGKKLVVCCPDGYFRKGNVEIVCDRYGIEMVESFETLVKRVQERLAEVVDVTGEIKEQRLESPKDVLPTA
ncbi:hypothetical protein BD310DRAFT_929872 [Dichomitus squalens]|uniref:Uncharacterized protein n=1 Tax=Dichomitus squalens TaxID=114155 RepID=A0A4Q9PS09_9APHY|nr:hypothetical protein BD310DRAFT_929872 [Dichomitus squalens]